MPSSSPLLPHTGRRAGDRSIGRRPGPAGFALVIALVLMGFIMMLVLTLSSLVQTNLATSTLEQQASQAQRNALLGVQVAIGQLQQYAGADKRATARADIAGAAVRNPQWTGVWNEGGDLLTYFVSGNENSADALKYDDSSVLSTDRNAAADSLGILLSGSTVAGDVDTVAKLVRIGNSGSEGGYAYWVSDESVKAKINLLPVTKPTTSAPDNFGLVVPQMFGFADLQPWFNQAELFTGDNALNDANLLKLGAAIDMGTLSAYKGDSAKDLSRDVTFYSYGVLSNPRTGGLKKDLTAAFDVAQATSLPASLKDKPIIAGKTGTPLWDQLYSWVQATPSGGSLPVRAATNEQSGIYPVLLGYQLYMVPAYRTVDGEDWLYTYIVPAVALWNPYNYPLESKSYNILAGRVQRVGGSLVDYLEHVAANTFAQAYIMLLQKEDGNYETSNRGTDSMKALDSLRNVVNAFSGGSYDHNKTLEFTIQNVSLAPGEVKIFSAEENQPFVVSGRRELVEGYRPYGFYIDLDRKLERNSEGAPITNFKLLDVTPTRTGALQLSIDEGDILSDAVYLNQALGSSKVPINQVQSIRPFKAPDEDLILDGAAFAANTDPRFGWMAIRNIGINSLAPLARHRERNQLDADYKWLAHYNPRASTSGPHPLSYMAKQANYDLSTTANPSFISLSDHFGDSINEGVSRLVTDIKARSSDGIVLFEASPGVENLFSIGQLTHAPLFYWNDGSYSPRATTRVRPRVNNAAFDNLMPAYAIGNSLASPVIPLGETEYTINFNADSATFSFPNSKLYDYSYLLNEALWDDYFFSAVTSSGNDAQNNPIYAASRNPRLSLVPGKQTVDRGLNTSAEDLLINGPFNVNSTSENAWKALLTSFYGRTPGTADRITAAQPTDSALTSFMRVANSAKGDGSTDLGVDDKDTYSGYNTLSEEQIDKLANAIVTEIRRRGIAPSLSAFVNRNPKGDEDSQLQGVLSAAIANAQLNSGNAINNSLRDSNYESSKWRRITGSDANLQNLSVLEGGYVTEGLPGWLTPADIFSRLGSVLTSRGDTFLIRAYGEYGDESSLSKAWCEAVVQRLPDPVDATVTDPSTDVMRRFVVVAFRWLSEDEI